MSQNDHHSKNHSKPNKTVDILFFSWTSCMHPYASCISVFLIVAPKVGWKPDIYFPEAGYKGIQCTTVN